MNEHHQIQYEKMEFNNEASSVNLACDQGSLWVVSETSYTQM